LLKRFFKLKREGRKMQSCQPAEKGGEPRGKKTKDGIKSQQETSEESQEGSPGETSRTLQYRQGKEKGRRYEAKGRTANASPLKSGPKRLENH